MRNLITITAVCIGLSFAGSADAKSSKRRGSKKISTQKIIDKVVERTPIGFVKGKAKVQMVLMAKDGDRRKRRLKAKSMKNKTGERRLMIKFDKPKEIRGTAVLLRENDGSDDDTYLYLPAFKRSRRVSGSDKRDAFVGSDFSYADMEHKDIEEASYNRQDDASVDGQDCYHIIVTPDDRKGYSKIELFIRKKDFLAQQIKYYSRKGKLQKVYRVHSVKEFDGEPTAAKAQMWTKKTGHSTFFIIDSLDRDAKLSKIDFTVESFGR